MKDQLQAYWTGLITGISSVILLVTYLAMEIQFPVITTSQCDIQQEPLVNRIDELYRENAILTKKLTNYEADEAYIKALPGADEDVAQKIIKASGALNVDPK